MMVVNNWKPEILNYIFRESRFKFCLYILKNCIEFIGKINKLLKVEGVVGEKSKFLNIHILLQICDI